MSRTLSPFIAALIVLAISGCSPRAASVPSDTALPRVTESGLSETPVASPTASFTPTAQPTANPPATPSTQLSTRLVSIDETGKPTTGYAVHLSDDGRYAVYGSKNQVYLRDLATDTTTLISAAPDGTRADGRSYAPNISADGNVIAFFAAASDLVDNPYEGCPEDNRDSCSSLYVYDRTSRVINRVLIAAPDWAHVDVALSSDGRYAAFAVPYAFIPGGREGVFRYDRVTEEIVLINEGVPGDPSTPSEFGSVLVDISADGQEVAFVTDRDSVVPDDTNGEFDVFVYSHSTSHIDRLSTPFDDVESGQPSGFQVVPNTGAAAESGLSISADGRYIVFTSTAPNLVELDLSPCQHWPWAEPLPACRHIYLYDRESNSVELISLSNDGVPGNRASEDSDISADGRWVAFTSWADNLTGDGPIECGDSMVEGTCLQVYVRDRMENRIFLVSQGLDGQLPDGRSFGGKITPDGRHVAFASTAGNLVVDVPASQDGRIFITDLFDLLEQ